MTVVDEGSNAIKVSKRFQMKVSSYIRVPAESRFQIKVLAKGSSKITVFDQGSRLRF